MGDKALVNKSESDKLTLASLRRNDNTIEEIIDTAKHVSLYEFQLGLNEWKRRDVEGSLFVVKRSALPRFQFIILNRLSPKNHLEDILDSTDLEKQAPYIMYKTSQQELLGLWFYEDKECEKIFHLLTKISLANKVSASSLDDDGNGSGRKKQGAAQNGNGSRKMMADLAQAHSHQQTKEKRSAAANEIDDLLGMLGGGEAAPATTTKATGGGGGGGDRPKERGKAQAAAAASSGGVAITKAQLKAALQRVVRKDEFVEMLYNEIKNGA
uniref:Uncharacterized protein n=1 Tax=Chloropicon laureae TaxID=464258 RepID=A0A7S3E489_9CHLO